MKLQWDDMDQIKDSIKLHNSTFFFTRPNLTSHPFRHVTHAHTNKRISTFCGTLSHLLGKLTLTLVRKVEQFAVSLIARISLIYNGRFT